MGDACTPSDLPQSKPGRPDFGDQPNCRLLQRFAQVSVMVWLRLSHCLRRFYISVLTRATLYSFQLEMEVLNIPTTHEPFVAPERAAAFLALSRKTVLKLARRGDLPANPVGRGVRDVAISPLGTLSVVGV